LTKGAGSTNKTYSRQRGETVKEQKKKTENLTFIIFQLTVVLGRREKSAMGRPESDFQEESGKKGGKE